MDIKKVLELLTERQKLENQYGAFSCIRFEKEYNKMDELQAEAMKEVKSAFLEHQDINHEQVYEQIDAIAYECALGNKDIETIEPSFYEQDEFIEVFVKAGFNERESEIFDEVFAHLGEEGRASYLFSKYTCANYSYYHDRLHKFIIII